MRGMAVAERVVSGARAAGLRTTVTIAAAFGCPFEGEVPTSRVAGLAARSHAGGRGRDRVGRHDRRGGARRRPPSCCCCS
jgi:hypothetical protein